MEGDRTSPLWVFLLGAGLWMGELVCLRWPSVDLDGDSSRSWTSSSTLVTTWCCRQGRVVVRRGPSISILAWSTSCAGSRPSKPKNNSRQGAGSRPNTSSPSRAIEPTARSTSLSKLLATYSAELGLPR